MQYWHDAGYSLAAEAFKTEFLCENEPLASVLEKVACACGSDGSNTGVCEGVLEKVPSGTVITQTLFATVKKQTLKSGMTRKRQQSRESIRA